MTPKPNGFSWTSTLRLLVAGGAIVGAIENSGAAVVWPSEECERTLAIARTTYEADSNLSQVARVHDAMCRETFRSWEQMRSSSQDAGIDYYEVFKLDYGADDYRSDVGTFQERLCTSLRSLKTLNANTRQRLTTINDKAVTVYEACKAAPGVKSWLEPLPNDPRTFSVNFQYKGIPALLGKSPKAVFLALDGASTIAVSDKDKLKSWCANVPKKNEELAVDDSTPLKVTCSLKDDFVGAFTVSAQIDLIGKDLPTIRRSHTFFVAPPKPAKAIPQLVLLQDGRTPVFAPIGTYVTADLSEGIVQTDGRWAQWQSKPFKLRISDPDGALSGDNISGRMRVTSWIAGNTNNKWDRHPQNKVIAVEKVLSDIDTAYFGDSIRVEYKGKPDKRSIASESSLQFDATQAQRIGVQVVLEGDGACKSDVYSSIPGGKPIDTAAIPPKTRCTAKIRICATDKYEGNVTAQNRCPVPVSNIFLVKDAKGGFAQPAKATFAKPLPTK